MFENPADNLGLGAYIILGVYNQGASDRFVWANEANKNRAAAALPTRCAYVDDYVHAYAYMHARMHTK